MVIGIVGMLNVSGHLHILAYKCIVCVTGCNEEVEAWKDDRDMIDHIDRASCMHNGVERMAIKIRGCWVRLINYSFG